MKSKVDIEDIKRLASEGKSAKEIAEILGCTASNIYHKLKEAESYKNKNTDGFGLDNVKQVGRGINRRVDPETGLVVEEKGQKAVIIGKIGDEKVSAFVQYHMEMMVMRQGVDKRNVPDLYTRFFRYLEYCREHNIVPNNMNAYFALGISRQDVSAWHRGIGGTPEHKEFADMIMSFFASIHEQGATDGVLNPISSMFWQKAHDGMIEASKLEVVQEDPLGDKKSAEDIAKAYSEVELPD